PRTTVSVLELHHAAHVLLSGKPRQIAVAGHSLVASICALAAQWVVLLLLSGKGGTRNCRQGDPVRPMTTAQMVRRMRPAARSQHLSIHHHYESDLCCVD